MTNGPDQSDADRRWTSVIVALIGVGCAIGIAVPAGLGWDFANFYDAGRRVAAGQITDLYEPLSLINGQAPQGRTGFFGTPLSAFLYVPLAGVPAGQALVLFKIQNVVAYGVTFAVLLRFYRFLVAGALQVQSRFMLLFAFSCLIYQPFWTVFRVGGQTTATVLLVLALGLVAHTNGRPWRSALCVVLASLIKPALAPAVLFLACVSGLAYLWRITALFAAAGVLSILLMGWAVHEAFLELMARHNQAISPWYFNSSIHILIDSFRPNADSSSAVGGLYGVFLALTYALKGAVVLTMVSLTVRGHRQRWSIAARRHFDFLLAIVLFLLWSSTVWEHYLSFLFPFLIYVLASREHFSRAALAIVAVIFVLSVGQNLILINWLRDGLEIDSIPELLGVTLFKSGPLLLTMVLLWRHAEEFCRSHASPAWNHYSERGRLEPS